MTLPTVTIGITCHNAAETIERAVVGALAQDWPDLEVIVVDDRSSDESWEKLQALAAGDHRLRVLRHEANRGYPGALNTILAHARGAFVAIFDDDDVSAPNRLRAQYERIAQYEAGHPGASVLCYSNRNVVKVGQTGVDHIDRAIGRTEPEPHGPAVADYVLGVSLDREFCWGRFGSCTLMARSEVFGSVGTFDESFRRSAELDYAIRAALRGLHFIAVDSPLVTQYKTESADKGGRVPLKYALQLRRKHRQVLGTWRLFLVSCLMAYAQFYGNTGRKLLSRGCLLAGIVLRPSLLTFLLGRRRGALAAQGTPSE